MTSLLQKRESPLHQGGVFKRIIKGVGAGILGQIINFANKILLVPLFLHAWGSEKYGEWLILSSFIAFLSLTEMGGTNYIVNLLTKCYVRSNTQMFRKTLHTGITLFLIIPGLVFLLFTLFVLIVPPENFLNITNTDHATVILVLVLITLQLLISLPNGIILGVYRATGQFHKGIMYVNLNQFLQLVLISMALWLGSGMIGISIIQLIPHVIFAILVISNVNKQFPEFNIYSLKETDLSYAKTFLKPSFHFLLIQLSQMLSIQGTILVVGMILNPIQVVLYSTLRMMANILRQVLSIISNSSWPELTRLDTEKKFDLLAIVYKNILRITLIGGGLFVFIFHIYGEEIYNLWLKGTVQYDPLIMDLFLIYILQLVFWASSMNLLMAINKHSKLSVIVVVSSLLDCIFGYVGGALYDFKGIIIGLIISNLLLPFWAVPYLVYRYNRGIFPFRFFAKEVLLIIILSLLVLII